MEKDVKRDKQQAEFFDSLAHPTRIKILKTLSEEPLSFSELKRRLGIESSGHLQHHLSKLGNLVKTDEKGRYCLSEHGEDALIAIQAIEKTAKHQNREKELNYKQKGEVLPKSTARSLSLLSLLFLVSFIWLQIASIGKGNENTYFLFLSFFSIFVLAAGTFLNLWTFMKSFEKRLCLIIAIIFIIFTSSVVVVFAQTPRGGTWKITYVTPESFTLTLTLSQTASGKQYYGTYSQTIYSTKHSISFIMVEPYYRDNILIISVSSNVNIQGTIYVFLIFRPYDPNAYALFQKNITFNETTNTVSLELFLILERGNFKTRYDGYELEFSVRLAFKGTGTLPHTLNFTVDTTALKLRIDEYIVESSLQNNICTALLGILIGINMYIPGKQFPQKLYKKLTKKSLGAATSRHNLSVIKHYFKTQKLFSLAATFPILFIAYLASSLTLFYSKKFH